MIGCVVFDFDGTLVDSAEIKKNTFVSVVSKYKEGKECKEIIEKIRDSEDAGDRYDIFRKFQAHVSADNETGMAHNDELCLKLAQDYTTSVKEQIIKCKEIDGARQLLEKLKENNIPVYVNSATPMHDLVDIIDTKDMGGYFCGIYGAPGTKKDNLADIKRRLDIEFNKIVVVGDGTDDQLSAMELGCLFIPIKSKLTKLINTSIQPVGSLHEVSAIIFSTLEKNREPGHV